MSFKMAGKFNGCFNVNNASLQLNNTDNSFFLFFLQCNCHSSEEENNVVN